MRRMQEAGAAHDHVAGLDGHIHFTLGPLKSQLFRVIRAANIRFVGAGQGIMQRMTLEVRTRDHAQAAIFGPRIHEINHHEALHGPRRIADRMVPEEAILMPKQGRALGGFADDEASAPLGIVKTQLRQRGQHGRIGDERSQGRVFRHRDEAALRPIAREMGLILPP